MRHVSTVLASVLLATVAALGLSSIEIPKAAAAAGVRSCTGGTIDLSAAEKSMLQLHNRARKDRGRPRLCVHPKLQRAAEAHSRDMLQRDYFSHNTKGRNESECQRIRRYGYDWSACAENIAWGTGAAGSAERIFRDSWMKSKAHRSNILSAKYKEVGIGASKGKFMGHDNATVWTVDFGSRR